MNTGRRLSRLQKYILRAAIENEGRIPGSRSICIGFWGAERVYQDCLEFHRYHRRREPPCIGNRFRASLSRSLQGLEDKGFIEAPLLKWPGSHRPRHIELTHKGGEMELKLTSISPAELSKLIEAAEAEALKLTSVANEKDEGGRK